jgi:asparagine synthase (glutamine-hydrolysing)
MAVSLETRAPFLDPDLFAFAWSLPLAQRVDRRAGKKVLRQVLHRHVPTGLVERRKTPFGAPLAAWLRGPLRDWAEELLSERRLRDDGYLEPSGVRQRWHQHLAGERNWQHHLWGVLMFNSFLDRWKPPAD